MKRQQPSVYATVEPELPTLQYIACAVAEPEPPAPQPIACAVAEIEPQILSEQLTVLESPRLFEYQGVIRDFFLDKPEVLDSKEIYLEFYPGVVISHGLMVPVQYQPINNTELQLTFNALEKRFENSPYSIPVKINLDKPIQSGCREYKLQGLIRFL